MPKRIGDIPEKAREKLTVALELARLRRDLRLVDLSNRKIAVLLGISIRRVQQYIKGAQPTPNETSPATETSPETPTPTLQTGGGEQPPPSKLRNCLRS